MQKVVVIGAGASGMLAAIYASNNSEVTILERNNNCCKKILITGNGKCNYWNESQSLDNYNSDNKELIPLIMNENTNKEVLEFFKKIGIVPKIKNGYYYPYSSLAASIKEALLLEAKHKNIKIENNILVEKIEKKENKFIINDNIVADKVVLACGSKAAPTTGSDGIGYILAKQLGHEIIEPLPALVQLTSNAKYLKKWNGIRTDVEIKLYIEDKLISKEQGEIQLTDYGISGICTFNLSREVSKNKNKNKYVLINFLPWLNITTNQLESWIEDRNKTVKNRNMMQLFEGILNYKLLDIILEQSKIKQEETWTKLNNEQKNKFITNLLEFKLGITGTNSFDKAQVCSGGVKLTEINPETMESLKVKGLYIVGELLDVDGKCGGYNLGFAWTTGMLAGLNTKGENND